ncbi:hypothetical protein [Marinibactrum halimedae]|uniref:Uncharacterized protein n=1 Tax=Marinibactrum halimedae TaxID=1444977 RepID=A0AA37WPN1_9GAMM|nr:hypothetical protein [Marinibactrum halimedae]MCD9457847.1 hypothetical protein [Marinibactrum halimedae]GLS26332.1 hypothetical protein GCM10007877_20470 [Marinibactrum halimedae]
MNQEQLNPEFSLTSNVSISRRTLLDTMFILKGRAPTLSRAIECELRSRSKQKVQSEETFLTVNIDPGTVGQIICELTKFGNDMLRTTTKINQSRSHLKTIIESWMKLAEHILQEAEITESPLH